MSRSELPKLRLQGLDDDDFKKQLKTASTYKCNLTLDYFTKDISSGTRILPTKGSIVRLAQHFFFDDAASEWSLPQFWPAPIPAPRLNKCSQAPENVSKRLFYLAQVRATSPWTPPVRGYVEMLGFLGGGKFLVWMPVQSLASPD